MDPIRSSRDPIERSGVQAYFEVPEGLGLPRRMGPKEAADAFESVLIGHLLKPLEDSLRESGLFPSGAAGETYAYFWKRHLADQIARWLDLLPGWAKEADRGAGAAQRGSPLAPSAPLNGPGSGTTAEAGPASLVGGTLSASAGEGEDRLAIDRSKPLPSGLRRLLSRLSVFEPALADAARSNGLEPNLLRAVVIQESGARPDARSPKGALGLMQLLPSTAASLGVSNPLDPQQNLAGGARYLASLLSRFGDLRLALAAYNAGPSAVERYGGIPPFGETRRYVEGVLSLKGLLDSLIR